MVLSGPGPTNRLFLRAPLAASGIRIWLHLVPAIHALGRRRFGHADFFTTAYLQILNILSKQIVIFVQLRRQWLVLIGIRVELFETLLL